MYHGTLKWYPPIHKMLKIKTMHAHLVCWGCSYSTSWEGPQWDVPSDTNRIERESQNGSHQCQHKQVRLRSSKWHLSLFIFQEYKQVPASLKDCRTSKQITFSYGTGSFLFKTILYWGRYDKMHKSQSKAWRIFTYIHFFIFYLIFH